MYSRTMPTSVYEIVLSFSTDNFLRNAFTSSGRRNEVTASGSFLLFRLAIEHQIAKNDHRQNDDAPDCKIVNARSLGHSLILNSALLGLSGSIIQISFK